MGTVGLAQHHQPLCLPASFFSSRRLPLPAPAGKGRISRGLQRADARVPKTRGASTVQPTEHIMDRYCLVLPASGALGQRRDKATVPGLRELPVSRENGMAINTLVQKCPSESVPSGPAPRRAFNPRKTRWWNQQMFVSPLKSGHPLCKAPPDGFSSRAVSQWDVARQSGSWAGGREGDGGPSCRALGPWPREAGPLSPTQ